MRDLACLNDKELRVSSVEMVDIINSFRKLECEKLGESKLNKPLRHDNFKTKIKKEIEILKSAKIFNERNFKETFYINSQNKQQPCYLLNRDGMLQMLNSESVLVRFKTIEYINNLEEENIKLKNQLNTKANLLLSIYGGGQDAVLASKQLADIEVEVATQPLLAKIENDKPLVDFGEQVLKSNDNILVRELAKIISDEVKIIGQNRLYEKLREWGFVMKNKTEPYQKYIDNGYFVLEENAINTPYGNRIVKTCKVSPRGQIAIVEKFRKELNLAS